MNISVAFLSLLLGGFFTQYLSAEEELWYNAAGEVVKVTQVVKKKVSLVQENKPYTSAALYALHGGPERKVQRFRTGYSFPQYYHPVWRRTQQYSYRRPYYFGGNFQGSYNRNYSRAYNGRGWSAKLKF
ncbi:hypothetical protein OAI07_01515 [Akkermansiaceae bacterium]|nr:hypothetical protein [Akkermansiaceae bacterium]